MRSIVIIGSSTIWQSICAAFLTARMSDSSVRSLDSLEALNLAALDCVDLLVLIDREIPDERFVDIVRESRATFPHASIAIISNFRDPQYISRYLAIGVKGFLSTR